MRIDRSEIDTPKVPKLSRANDTYFCPTCLHGVGYLLPVSGKLRIMERKCEECGQKLKWCDGED